MSYTIADCKDRNNNTRALKGRQPKTYSSRCAVCLHVNMSQVVPCEYHQLIQLCAILYVNKLRLVEVLHIKVLSVGWCLRRGINYVKGVTSGPFLLS